MLWQSHDERLVIRTLEWCHEPKEIKPVMAVSEKTFDLLGLSWVSTMQTKALHYFLFLDLAQNHWPYISGCKTTLQTSDLDHVVVFCELQEHMCELQSVWWGVVVNTQDWSSEGHWLLVWMSTGVRYETPGT